VIYNGNNFVQHGLLFSRQTKHLETSVDSVGNISESYTYFVCRPGRLEIQIEIGLPDEKGRLEIFRIHTNKMKENSFLAADINLEELGAL
jgi:hypothetical protein